LEAALSEAAKAPGVEGAQAAREAVSSVVAAAQHAQKLGAEEAEDLRKTLELEINLEFGARHEDSAIEAYEARLGKKVYGQQHRVSVPMPSGGAAVALSQAVFPAPHAGPRSRDDKKEADATSGEASSLSKDESRPFFRLTGFVDGLVDVPRASPAPPNATVRHEDRRSLTNSPDGETLVVEVKHRMGRIKDPPEIYDIVQLCSYCRALGCNRGDLVQCLRSKGTPSGRNGEVLHVTRIDFSEGSPDRQGWDKHVLPNLYATAEAVYAAREDQMIRLRLLASTPEERLQLVGEICPHLG